MVDYRQALTLHCKIQGYTRLVYRKCLKDIAQTYPHLATYKKIGKDRYIFTFKDQTLTIWIHHILGGRTDFKLNDKDITREEMYKFLYSVLQEL